MKLAALLVEIRRLMPPLPPAHTDPLRAIYQGCDGLPRSSSERQALERLALAITQGSEVDIDEREAWKRAGRYLTGCLVMLFNVVWIEHGKQARRQVPFVVVATSILTNR